MNKIRNICMPVVLLPLGVQDSMPLPEIFPQQSAVLPVTWVYVKPKAAAYNMVVIQWATMAEPNNHAFIIERSEDGNLYQQIEKLPGKGNNGGNNYYHVTDRDLKGGTKYYYRIGLRDPDWQVEYSPTVVTTTVEEKHLSVHLFPNPANELIFVETGSGNEQPVNITIMNVYGKVYFSNNVRQSSGTQLAVQVAGWPPGTYILKIFGPGRQIKAAKFFLKQ